MSLYLLFESTSDYALFHAHGLDEISRDIDNIRNSVLELEHFVKVFKLHGFHPFAFALDGLNLCNTISEGMMTEELSLPKTEEGKKAKFSLGVAEPQVECQIFETTKILCQSNEFVLEFLCCMMHFDWLIKDLISMDLKSS